MFEPASSFARALAFGKALLFVLVVAAVYRADCETVCGRFRGVPEGLVTDVSAAVIVGARVEIRQRQTGAKRVALSGMEGQYQVENLAPEEYEIQVSAQGFRPVLQLLILRVGDNQTVNFELQVGQVDEAVEVKELTSGLNTTDHKVSGSISRVQVASLPLNSRNFLELA